MTRFNIMKRRILVLGTIALVASACGGGDDDAEPTGDESAATAESAESAESAEGTSESEAVAATDEAASDDATESSSESSSETTPLETTPPNTADSSEATTPPATEATTAEPAVTTAPESDPTETADPATAFDWVAIVQQLVIDLDRIGREPAIELVDAACAPDSQCSEENLNVVETLTSQGLRLAGGGASEVVSVEYVGTVGDVPFAEATGIVLDVSLRTADGEPATLVDADGNVVQELSSDIEPGTVFTSFWVLSRSGDGTTWLQFSARAES